MSDCSFEGRVALVTGASSGLGRQHALELARRGAKVMINDIARDEHGRSKAEAFAAELAAEGLTVAHNTNNIGIEAQARGVVDETVREFGRIDILVNNAGNGTPGTAYDTSTADFRSIIDVHVFGMFWAMQQALGHMRAQNYGRIINTASGTGAFGMKDAFAYVTAKAAIFGMTKAAALDTPDHDIRINTLSPVAYTQLGYGYTAFNPRFTEEKMHVRHVTPVVLMLAHENCTLHGEAISAAGGRAAKIFEATVRGYYADPLTCEGIFENLDAVFDDSEFFALKNSRDQYELIPD